MSVPEQDIPRYQTGRKLALIGTPPRGRLLAAQVIRHDVSILNSVNELREYTVGTRQTAEKDKHKQIDSIVVVTRPGDDLAEIPAIYTLAVDAHILVTTVIVTAKKCSSNTSAGTNAILQGSSDIIVRTSDESYLRYMLECVLA